jgi:lipopolysaccharide/colanic/teichoic acid biosynthesis glycosyltransferase
MSRSLNYFYGSSQEGYSLLKKYQQSSECSPNRSLKNISNYLLKWRQNKLVVQLPAKSDQFAVSVIDHSEWLFDRLQNSPAHVVVLDQALGEERLQIWAEACERAKKRAYLRLPAMPRRPQRQYPLSWWFKRQMDWIVGVLLLGLFGPIMVLISLLLKLESTEPVLVQYWCVGERGRLFRCFRFRTAIADQIGQIAERMHLEPQSGVNLHRSYPTSTKLGRWLYRTKLDRLPLLWNVLRGEMSLVGSYPIKLTDIKRMNPALSPCLNALPGALGARSRTASLLIQDTSSRCYCELKYVQNWSLGWDFKFLISATSRILSIDCIDRA